MQIHKLKSKYPKYISQFWGTSSPIKTELPNTEAMCYQLTNTHTHSKNECTKGERQSQIFTVLLTHRKRRIRKEWRERKSERDVNFMD